MGELDPHIFAIAEEAYTIMKSNEQNSIWQLSFNTVHQPLHQPLQVVSSGVDSTVC